MSPSSHYYHKACIYFSFNFNQCWKPSYMQVGYILKTRMFVIANNNCGMSR